MKFPLKTTIAALALFAATPSSAELVAGTTDCNDVITGQGLTSCVGMFETNIFNTANEADLNEALDLLMGDFEDVVFTGPIDDSKDFFEADGEFGITFDDALTGAVIIGLKVKNESGLFLFNFTEPTDSLTLNVNGFSSGVIIPPGTEVPEPATWAMMLLGFGAIGYSIRRRRKPVLAQVA
jgi:hypothetical protein